MEFLRKLFVQTRNHLEGLTLSQRLAIGSCVALLAVALLWMVNWASEPALVPLLEQPMSAQDLGRIQERLDAQGTGYKVVGDVIMVPAEDRAKLLAQFGQQRLLPDDISIGFAKLLDENSSPWLSIQEQDRRWSLALGNELSRVLREFSGLLDARVFIDKNARRTIGRASVVPTASVYVKLEEGVQLDRDRIYALASFVSRAVSGLDIHNVAVTDATTGRSGNVPRPEEGWAYDDLEDRQKKEEYFASKIKELLAHIPGLLVKVHAELDPESRHETQQVYGKPVMEEDRSESETRTRGVTAAEPGVVPNTSRAVAGGSPTESTEKNTTESRYKGEVDTTVTTIETPRHNIKSLSASVNVPKSYLVSVYEPAHGGEEPTDDELEVFFKANVLAKITKQVMGALDIDQDKVQVDWFPDGATVAFGGAVQAGVGEGMMGLVKAYWDKAGLGALAVVSLLMMLMMVRKVAEGPVLPGEEPPRQQIVRVRGERRDEGGEPMVVGEATAGEARESEHLLVGKEVDEATVRTQQVVDQVTDMIQGDPDAAAVILQRWAAGKQ